VFLRIRIAYQKCSENKKKKVKEGEIKETEREEKMIIRSQIKFCMEGLGKDLSQLLLPGRLQPI
jgi:hypothetical protein